MQNFLRFFCKKMKMINACTHILYIIMFLELILQS